MKKTQRSNKKPVKRRHIEDIPFYLFEYGADDLPLDPAKPFILQKIRKLNIIKIFKYDSLKLQLIFN